MTKIKCVNGFPLWEIKDVPLEGDSYRRVARNLYVCKKGYMVKYWTKEEGLIEERYDSVGDVRDAYELFKVKGDFIHRC